MDAYRAVQLASSYHSATRTGHTLATATTQFNATGSPSSVQKFSETLTNSGTTIQRVHSYGRTLGAYSTIKTASVTLSDDSSQKYVDFQGITDNYETVTFTVPTGERRLNASIAFQNASATDLAARVRMDLVDPSGHLASYSLPQGNGNYGNGEVANPQGGTWTAYIESRVSGNGGTEGPVVFAAQVAKFANFGTVTPSYVTLAPGASAAVTLTAAAPSKPGDEAGSLVTATSMFDASIPATTTVPVTIRAAIPAGTQSFTDTLTGGNGRAAFTGQTFYYSLQVPQSTPELNANVTLSSGPTNSFYAYLIAPNGTAQASAANQKLTSFGGGTAPAGEYQLGAQLHVLSPPAGSWTLIVVFAPQVSGTAISTPFTVRTDDSIVPVSSSHLPNSTNVKVKAGSTTTVYVAVKNTGTSPESYFVDPRLATSAVLDLAPLTSSSTTEPLKTTSSIPLYLVPTNTATIGAAAQTDGTSDIQFDMGAPAGDPDVESTVGKTVTASYSATGGVSQGAWDIAPTEVGPYPAAGTTENVDTVMLARSRPFDTAFNSSTGDLWETSVDPNATLNTITVGPGLTAVIPIQIRPTGSPRTVRGTLYVDDADVFTVFGSASPNGNQVAALPYSYTITK